MLTVTKDEYNRIYRDASNAFCKATYDLYRKNKYGMELCNEVAKIKQLFIYIMALSTWTQDEFDDNYHYNCLEKGQIFTIYSKIKKLN